MKTRMVLGGILAACLLLVWLPLTILAEESIYYARCNLKAVGNDITWVNWQASPSFIPAGTKLKVTRDGSKATLINAETNASYTLDIGADGDQYLEKFVSKTPVSIKAFSSDVQASIKDTTAKVGMTKEQVYISMGPPMALNRDRTNVKTYQEIMNGDLWIYARRKFGKNIGVAFDPESKKVNRTEGIWK